MQHRLKDWKDAAVAAFWYLQMVLLFLPHSLYFPFVEIDDHLLAHELNEEQPAPPPISDETSHFRRTEHQQQQRHHQQHQHRQHNQQQRQGRRQNRRPQTDDAVHQMMLRRNQRNSELRLLLDIEMRLPLMSLLVQHFGEQEEE